MLGQSVGSMVVAWEALMQQPMDIFLDTTGCAFTYIVAKVLGVPRVVTYTHYPTITSVSRPLRVMMCGAVAAIAACLAVTILRKRRAAGMRV
jgi:hypothetical protein